MGLYDSVKRQYQWMLDKKAVKEREKGKTIYVDEKLEFNVPARQEVCFGVIGSGHVFDRWMHDILMLPGTANIRVKGITAGHSNSAAKKANLYGIPMVYADFDVMLRDPDINAVYVATPNHLHAEHTIKALNAGKHVLCEKPIAVNTEELARMQIAAKESGAFLMEGMWMRTLPMIRELQKEVLSGAIGDVRFIETVCCNNDSEEQYPAMYSREKAGGALMDVGCYALHFLRLFLSGVPEIKSIADITESGVDRTTIIMLQYPKAVASVTQSIGAVGGARAVIHGTEGSIEVPLFLQPDGFVLSNRNGFKTYYNYRVPREKRPIGYAYEILHFADLVRSGDYYSKLIPEDDTILVAQQMEAIRKQCGIRLANE